jgi:endonuclease YncB( thermonuclease family)
VGGGVDLVTYTVPAVYERRATVTRVIDGDTLYLAANVGLDITVNMTVRLYGLNCPEMNTDAGKAAKAWVEQWVRDHAGDLGACSLRTVKDKKEKYGRYLADLLPDDGSPSLCTALLDAGQAVPYMI